MNNNSVNNNSVPNLLFIGKKDDYFSKVTAGYLKKNITINPHYLQFNIKTYSCILEEIGRGLSLILHVSYNRGMFWQTMLSEYRKLI